jgi:hypothetical protein
MAATPIKCVSAGDDGGVMAGGREVCEVRVVGVAGRAGEAGEGDSMKPEELAAKAGGAPPARSPRPKTAAPGVTGRAPLPREDGVARPTTAALAKEDAEEIIWNPEENRQSR